MAARDSLKCDLDTECSDWWALELERPAALEVELDADTASAWNVVLTLVLRAEDGREIAHERTDERPTIVLRAELPAGRTLVEVRSVTAGNTVPYALIARAK